MIVVNPIVSGGVSSSKLALATATAADVVEGKSFYAGSKTIQAGTLKPKKVVTGSTWWHGDSNGYMTLSVSTDLKEINRITGFWYNDDNSYYKYSFYFYYDSEKPSDTYGRFIMVYRSGDGSYINTFGSSILTITDGQFIILLNKGYTNENGRFDYTVIGY